MAVNNSVNLNGTGLATSDGDGTFTYSTVTQYGTVVAGSTNNVSSVAPSATTGVPLISQGASANPVYGTAVVAGGGTGVATLTDGGVILGSGTGAVTSLAQATNGQLVIGSTSGDPVLAAITSTDGSLTVTNGAGTIVIEGTAASATQVGSVELATDTETNTGTSTILAITPANLTAWTGDTALVTTGTITTGTWQGTTVAVDQGGTGATTLGDGFILLGSGTGAITALDATVKGKLIVGDGTTDPIALTVGANDTVLTADSTEASGVKWAAAGGGGAWTYLSSVTADDDATMDFTSLITSTYNIYMFTFDNALPATDAVTLRCQTSTDGGSTWAASSGDYSHSILFSGGSNSSQTAGYIQLTAGATGANDIGSASSEGASGRVYLYNPANAANFKRVDGAFAWNNTVADIGTSINAGTREDIADIDAMRFLMSSGNVTSGTIRMYGLASS